MTIDPFLNASLMIQIHASTASVALLLGPLVIHRHRRDRLHKVLGYVWVVAMAVAALSSFGIVSYAVVGPFSPIHLLSVLALVSLWRGVRAAIQRDIARHQAVLRSLYWRGVMIAGSLTLLPGRVVNEMLFPANPDWGFAVIALGLSAVLYDIFRGLRHKRALSQAKTAQA